MCTCCKFKYVECDCKEGQEKKAFICHYTTAQQKFKGQVAGQS